MDRLDTLLSSVYGGKVVRKDLLHQIKGGENVPSYVLEYLLGRYCASDDPEEIRLGIEAVKATLQSNYFRHDEANKAQSLVEQQGKHRFIPFVEKNYNFIELGPRGTGKSYIFSEMSPYCILISGGKASSANLFYNNARRQVGLVGHWDLVAFDEVGGMKVQDPDTIQIMKDYMANGRFSRGVTQVHADASMVFVGNLNQSVETLVQSAGTDLFQPLPKEFDLAVMDRLHCYLPGWEIPKTSKDLLTDHYGFVTDYLAEAFRVLRKENRFDALDGRFSFGSHVEGRDATAVRKTVSGLLKLLHPHGDYTKAELQEYLELGLEVRRRVKEQLKKRGSFEFYKTSFSYIDREDDVERTVGVPEQGGSGAISQDPLPPGTVYTGAMDNEGKVALYRLEVTVTAGTGRLRTPAGLEQTVKESLNRAWTYLLATKNRAGLAPLLAQKDVVAEAIDLSGGRIECPCGVAFLAAMQSAVMQRRVQAGTIVLGDLTIQGNVRALPSITEVLQLARDNGAIRALLPTGNKAQFSSLSEDVVEKLDIVFYSDVERAVARTLEV
jgi:ATP-dependent Lon protease